MKSNPSILVCALALLFAGNHTQAAEASFGAGFVTIPSRPVRLIDGSWDPRFGLPPGVNGEVLCTTFFRGDLYVGGRFTRAGNFPVKGLARWDGNFWWPVSDGVEGVVMALTTFGNSLYVGGSFRTLGPLQATNIARLTRHGWEPLGDGIPLTDLNGHAQAVTAIAVRGKDVFVGGVFSVAGNHGARNVAQWNGQRWLALEEGIGRVLESGEVFGEVNALAVLGKNLYVGGRFDRAGTVWATNIARWNGDRWLPLGQGLSVGRNGYSLFGSGIHSGQVSALAVQDRQLLVGGDFTRAGAQNATNLARWNGRNWSPFARGVSGGTVSDSRARGPEVFVAGNFTAAGGVPATNVARWDGRRWKALEEGVRGFATTLALRGKDLYVGGYFGLAGGQPAAFIARWNRGEWFPLAPAPILFPPPFPPPGGLFPGTPGNDVILAAVTNAVIGDIRAIAANGDNAYIGGTIWSAGILPVNNIARWNGTHWSALGHGIPNGSIQQISVEGTNVYVAGNFTLPEAGATNLAVWNGQRWTDVGGGVSYSDVTGTNFYPASITAIQASRGKLYVAGPFMSAGGVVVNGLACWDGTNWTANQSAAAPPEEPLAYSPIDRFATGDDKVYAQGNFAFIGGTNANSIAQWDDTNWSPLGDGLHANPTNPAFVRTLAAQGSNHVYLAGDQLAADPLAAPTNLLHWDGVGWSAPGMPTLGPSVLLALATSSNRLFIGGYFTNVAGQPAGHLARWDGTNYSTLSGGVSAGGGLAYVSGLAQANGKAYVIGQFNEANGQTAFNFGIWNEGLRFGQSPFFSPLVQPPSGPILTNVFFPNLPVLPPREIQTNAVFVIRVWTNDSVTTNIWAVVNATNLPGVIQLQPAPAAAGEPTGAVIQR